MGFQLTLDTDFTDTSLPVLRNDPLLAAGSLFLLDLGHSQGNLINGGVASGGFPNIAWAEAADVLGHGDETSLAASFANATSTGTAFERTPKGGLHGAVRQNNTLTAGSGGKVVVPNDILSYIQANPTNDFYISLWHQVTRASADQASGLLPVFAVLGNVSGGTNNCLFVFDRSDGNTKPNSGSGFRLGALALPGFNSVAAPTFRNIGASEYSGTKPANLAAMRDHFAFWGAIDAYANAPSGQTGMPSWVLYRAYIEDLTVSGRSYATVSAADQAMFNTAFGAGGRYSADSWTAPATLAGA